MIKKRTWFILILFIVTAIWVSLEHRQRILTVKLHESTYIQLIEEATHHSITASKTVNPILALVSVTKAAQIMDTVQSMQGQLHLSYITGLNTADIRNIIRNQRVLIIKDILGTCPTWTPYSNHLDEECLLSPDVAKITNTHE